VKRKNERKKVKKSRQRKKYTETRKNQGAGIMTLEFINEKKGRMGEYQSIYWPLKDVPMKHQLQDLLGPGNFSEYVRQSVRERSSTTIDLKIVANREEAAKLERIARIHKEEFEKEKLVLEALFLEYVKAARFKQGHDQNIDWLQKRTENPELVLPRLEKMFAEKFPDAKAVP